MGAAARRRRHDRACHKPVLPASQARWRERADRMRITLNLATRPFADLGPAIKRLRIGMAVLAVLCLLFVLGLHLFDSQAEEARAREHSLDGQIARVQAERQQRSGHDAPARQRAGPHAGRALNELFDEKAFSWTLAMEAMETVLPGRRAGHFHRAACAPRTATSPCTSASLGPATAPSIWCATSSTPGDSLSRASWAKAPSPATTPIAAPGAGQRLQSLRLRSARRLQSAHARRSA